MLEQIKLAKEGLGNGGKGKKLKVEDEVRMEGFERRDKAIPDSLRQRFSSGDSGNRDRMSTEDGMMRGGRHGGGDIRDGKKIRLGTVGWFLAVFASFTVISIYLDKAYNLIRRKKLKKSTDILQ